MVANQSAMLALDAQRGDFAVRTDVGKTFVLKQSSSNNISKLGRVTNNKWCGKC